MEQHAQKQLKTTLPITSLPSFCVIAEVLALYGWLDQVQILLYQLTRSTRAYL